MVISLKDIISLPLSHIELYFSYILEAECMCAGGRVPPREHELQQEFGMRWVNNSLLVISAMSSLMD